MSLSDMILKIGTLINKIETLNEEGIKIISSSRPDRFDLAIKMHEKAANIAKKLDTNLDYYAVSIANMAYALRHRDNDSKKVLGLLDEALDEMGYKPSSVNDIRHSYFGIGRILEEKGLVIRYDKERTVKTLMDGLTLLEDCLYFYKRAIISEEIGGRKEIENRFLRTTGIASTIASEIASKDESLKDEYNKRAVSYAQKELDMRLKRWETKGFDLMNAYHTVGSALTEMVCGMTKSYYEAKENLIKAQELAENPLVQSVLKLRLGWLEYKGNPDNFKEIEQYVDNILADQDKSDTKWTSAVKSALKEKMFTLGKHLGPDYVNRLNRL